MKKTILMMMLFLTSFINSNAQHTKLHDFNNLDGIKPSGLTISSNDSILYGITTDGTTTIYSINTDGTNFLNLHTFLLNDTNGSNPCGSLIRNNSKLYGMTSTGGSYGGGTIYSINTNGTNYSRLYSFKPNDTTGSNPKGTLAISGNVLYGMTYNGGNNGIGVIFSIHTDGSTYKNLLHFNGTNGQLGGLNSPFVSKGALIISDSTLYGTTLYGGINGLGVLFSIHKNGSGYNKLFDFDRTNGILPIGSLSLTGNILYGITSEGGIYNNGAIYSIHTDGSKYKNLFNFKNSNGQYSEGSLTISNSKDMLYVTTANDGTDNLGNIFSLDTSGTNFTTIFNFNSSNGAQPRSSLLLVGTTLYGTTESGGTNSFGTIFSYKTSLPALPLCMVTVDDSSTHNHIIWQKPISTQIDSFIIYREITTNNYKIIGALPYSALSEFIDTVEARYFPFTGNPKAGSCRYKLQVKNKDGNTSSLSPFHNTIFVTNTGGTFNWNQYRIENDSIPLPSITSYLLYRDDNNTGTWHQIQAVSVNQTTVSDPDYASFPNGNWRVETNWANSCVIGKTYTSIKSNKSKIVSTGIQINNQTTVNIYPNPAVNDITIDNVKNNVVVKLINLLGQIVLEKQINGKTTIDVSLLPRGIYTIVTDKFVNKIILN